MNCANHTRKNCAQGHQPCPTPWTCGGYASEAHYAAMQHPITPLQPSVKTLKRVERFSLRFFVAVVVGLLAWAIFLNWPLLRWALN